MQRRTLLALLAIGLLKPWAALAAAWNKEAFGAHTVADVLKGLGAASTTPSKDIVIEAPQIAENGMVVPIEVTSNIPNTRAISILVEKNPSPLAGRFEFLDGALPFVKVNVKMAETSDIRVVAEAGGRHFAATKEIKVTIGGCGG
jgi:sulfur-oxidizing protein SoxY